MINKDTINKSNALNFLNFPIRLIKKKFAFFFVHMKSKIVSPIGKSRWNFNSNQNC